MSEKMQNNRDEEWVDLILNPPREYRNLFLIVDAQNFPIEGVVQIKIQSHCFSSKVLMITAWMMDLNQELQITIFHPKAFHQKLFPIQQIVFVYGKLQWDYGVKMIQPKIVKDYGKILPIFTRSSAKNLQIHQLVQTKITKDSLARLFLPQEIIEAIFDIFHPNLAFWNAFQEQKTFPKKYLDALKFVEAFIYLRRMRKKRHFFPAKFQCTGNPWEFVASLPFALTQGQKEAILALQQDLRGKTASKRMIMGDVGSGKTIVILSAVMIAYPHKTILMAPTTVLAQQLYAEACKFLPHWLRIGLFKGDLSSKKQSYIDFDFVIGTQALLYREESLEEFALMMCDEQHRFGTMQRHSLEKFASKEGYKPHIVQFSATPIPRTMAMLQSEWITHTFITDTPFKKEIDTRILRKQDFSFLMTHLREEIAKQHQIAIIYPLVEESEKFIYASLKESEAFWKKHFADVYATDGGDKHKEKVLEEFREKGSILLSTTVIEVGISLPRLSTIVIVGAERMGLATLHQLRGRVSRNGIKGYCFLFTYQENSQRLEEFVKTQNGFEIAELDLKYRKSGDLLSGKNQSGDAFKFFHPAYDEEILKKAREAQDKNLI